MATTASVTAVTQDFTFANPGRTPTASEINTYATELDAALLTNQQTAFSIASNFDALNNVIPVVRIYEGLMGRTPDAGGLAFWAAQLRAGTNPFTTLLAIIQGFESSAEFAGLYGSSTPNPSAFITALYHNVLGRNPDAGGLAFWLGQLGAAATIAIEANIVVGFTNSAEYIANSLVAIENWLTAAGLSGAYPATLTGAGGGGGGGIPQTFTMTLAADTIVGSGAGNDVINAFTIFNPGTGNQHNSLQNGDTISETGLNNSLNIFNSGNDAPAGLAGGIVLNIFPTKISGAQTWNITNANGVAAAGAGMIINAGASFTGLTTVNTNNSSSYTQVGAVGFALPQAVTTVGINNSTGTAAAGSGLVLVETAAALAGTTDAVTVNLNLAGVAGGAFLLTIAPETGVNGVEVFNLVNNGPTTSWVQLAVGGSATANTITVAGTANTQVAASAAASWNALATIDASKATGAVTISGATVTGSGTSGTGILATDAALKTIIGGTGNDNFDLSGAQFTAALINGMTKVDGGTGTNTLDLNAAVVAGTAPLTVPANFQVIGAGAGLTGTVNWINMGTAANTLTLIGAQAGLVTVNNAPTTFTVNEAAFGGGFGLTLGTVGPAAGTTDVFNLNFTAGNAVGALTTTGEETININTGAVLAGGTTIGAFAASATAGGNEVVNISGVNALTTGLVTLTAPGALIQINDTDTGLLTIAGTNAAQINAAASGGVVLTAADTFFVSNPAVAGSAGAVISGSLTAGNVLIGSTGNDTFTVGAGGSTILTGGGADTVKLGSGAFTDHIEFYVGTGAAAGGVIPASAVPNILSAKGDVAQPGWWGLATAGVATKYGNAVDGVTAAVGANAGTSLDQVSVTGFQSGTAPGADVLDFSVSAWGSKTAGASLGITLGDLTTTPGAATNIAVQQVASGGTVLAATGLIELIGITYSNANAMAASLHAGNPITFAATLAAAADNAHVLVAYQDAGGSTHIADVDLTGSTSAASTVLTVRASDMVVLNGVSMTSLNSAANLHWVA